MDDAARDNGNGLDRARLQDWKRRTEAVRARLTALHHPSEDAFLVIGERLREAHDAAKALTSMAAGLAARLGEEEMVQTLAGLDESAHRVSRLAGRGRGRGEIIAAVAAEADNIAGFLATLNITVLRVKMMSTNARVEAAQMVGTGIDFSVFTTGVGELADRGREAVDSARDRLDVLHEAAREALARQTRFEKEQVGEIEEVSRRLDESISAVRDRQADATRALERLPQELDGTAKRIGAVVSGLQVNDMTRQRLEHVETGMEVLGELIDAELARPDGDAMDGQRLMVLVNGICALQTRQLQDAGQEFAAKVDAILADLSGLGESIGVIRALAEDVHGGGHEDSAGFLLDVDRDLGRAATILGHYIEATGATERSLQSVDSAADAIARTIAAINEVDADMRLLGLNASIKCGNLGTKGRALNVIATELQAYAKQTGELAGKVAGAISAVQDGVARLSSDHDEDAEKELQALKAHLDRSVELLHGAGGETAWVLAEIHRRSQAVVEGIDEAVRAFDVRETTDGAIRQCVGELDAIATAADPGLHGQDLENAKRELLAFLEKHYTMESERRLHHAVFGGSDSVASFLLGEQDDTDAAKDADDLSDVLF